MKSELGAELTKAEKRAILKMATSANFTERIAGQEMLTKAIELPLRQGIMPGDNIKTFGIFETMDFTGGENIEFPLHWLTPGRERDFYAYNIPSHGKIARRNFEGDYVKVTTYDVGSSIDVNLRYLRDARWDVWSDAVQTYEDGFVAKINMDLWHCVLLAGTDRNILVYDSDAPNGQLTKRFFSLSKSVMARNGGGNTTSRDKFVLTDAYMSTEAFEDIRGWNIDQIDEVTRKEIFDSPDGLLTRIFSINLHELRELGVGQEYQQYFASDLAGTMASGDEEIVVLLDNSKRRSFVMPIKEELTTETDPTLRRENKMGIYGRMEYGCAALDNRCILIGSF